VLLLGWKTKVFVFTWTLLAFILIWQEWNFKFRHGC
jgi:hypothetical protein